MAHLDLGVRAQDTYLLGKFQIVAVPVVADYDAAFDVLQAASRISRYGAQLGVSCSPGGKQFEANCEAGRAKPGLRWS